MTMRILHVCNYGWPFVDGYTIRTAGMLTAQHRALGWTVDVVTSPHPPLASAQDPGFCTDAWNPGSQRRARPAAPTWERPGVGFAPRGGRALAAAVTRALQERRPDVVHVHHPHYVARPALRAASAAGVPVVYEVRCFNGDYDLDRRHPYARARGRWFNRLERRAALAADAVVTISHGLARRLVAAGVPRGRVHVVRNSVDTSRFTPHGPAWGRPDVRLHVGYATTFERIEGLDLLVEAVALARRDLAAGDLAVTLAGVGRDRDRIADLVAQRGLDQVVRLPGFVPYRDMPDWHRGVDVFAVTRHDAAVVRDTTPLKPLEALASGTPVWSTDLPAMRELLAGRDGVRLLPADPQTWARALVDAVGARPPRPDPAVGDRSWDAEVLRYVDVYASVGARP